MPASKRRLIKKYSNRKLYDTERRKFTTIDDLAALVESGVDVQVVDHDTGVDRTDEVLVQLVRRKVQTKPESSSLFSELLRAPADVAQSLVDGLTTISNLPEEAKLRGGHACAGHPNRHPNPIRRSRRRSGSCATRSLS